MRLKKIANKDEKKIKESSYQVSQDSVPDLNLPPKKDDDFPYKTYDARLVEKLQDKFDIKEVVFDATVGMRLFTINAPRAEVENFIKEEVR